MLKRLIARQMVRRTKSRLLPVEYLEQKHVDQNQPYPNDSSYFYGGDRQGNAFITRMAFRAPKRPNEYWFDFYLKEAGYFGLTSSPGPEGSGFHQGTLQWEPVEIGWKWRIRFTGQVHDRNGLPHDCTTDLMFIGENPVYDFEKSSDHTSIADAIAAEKWTRDFFHAMKDTHQVHYEQTGRLIGTIYLDGKRYEFDMMGSRDHSFGSRNWLTWDRHFWMTGVSDAGIHWTVTTIKWQFLGRLTAGFITHPNGTTDAIVDCTDLETVSKSKTLPDHGLIDIKTRSGKTHRMEFRRVGEFPYLHDGKYMMREGIGNYTFDGVQGLGMVEFGFHADLYKVD
ncbi:MAG TPA: hypothetical protein PKG48_13155 [Bacteroidales bacterium]|nr:hypothetical protein [Bacteroidales bacterium]HPS62677.1 hypothetical protein [Bacteroidales bacterium]